MENASKALIMAAGMLIGILIMSLFIYEMMYVSNSTKEYQDKQYITQITEFNAIFEKYANKEKITAHEVITLYNYVNEWNTDNEDSSTTINFSSNNLDLKMTISGTLTIEDFLDRNFDKEFKCELKYSDTDIAARVIGIIIKEK